MDPVHLVQRTAWSAVTCAFVGCRRGDFNPEYTTAAACTWGACRRSDRDPEYTVAVVESVRRPVVRLTAAAGGPGAKRHANAAERRDDLGSLWSVTTPTPARSNAELSDDERRRLEEAHRRLRDAVAAYEPFLARELKHGEPVPVHNADDMGRAQAAIEQAEQELWRLREELLGWTRPSWAPDAALVADWFSDEDEAYDETSPEAGP